MSDFQDLPPLTSMPRSARASSDWAGAQDGLTTVRERIVRLEMQIHHIAERIEVHAHQMLIKAQRITDAEKRLAHLEHLGLVHVRRQAERKEMAEERSRAREEAASLLKWAAACILSAGYLFHLIDGDTMGHMIASVFGK